MWPTPNRRPGNFLIALVLVTGLLSACAMKPQARMEAYAGAASSTGAPSQAMEAAWVDKPLPVGLVLLNDTTGSDSSPPLTDEAVGPIADQVRAELQDRVPLRVTKVIPALDAKPGQGLEWLIALANQQQVDHLVLVLISSAEIGVPVTLAPVGGSLSVSATRVDTFTLVEIALVDGKTGEVLVKASGRERSMMTAPQPPFPPDARATIGRRGGRPFIVSGTDPYGELRALVTQGAITNAVSNFQKAWYDTLARMPAR